MRESRGATGAPEQRAGKKGQQACCPGAFQRTGRGGGEGNMGKGVGRKVQGKAEGLWSLSRREGTDTV